jgi:hypothetical protein
VSVLDQDRAPANDSRSQLNGRWLGGLASSDCSSAALVSTLALVPTYQAELSWVSSSRRSAARSLGAGRAALYPSSRRANLATVGSTSLSKSA